MKTIKLLSITAMICSLCSFADAQEQKGFSAVSLLKPEFSSSGTLMSALAQRRSIREFKKDELSLQTVSNLLWAASGVNRPDSGKRTAPTAKNAQEIDVYVATRDGLYLYNAKAHQLDPLLDQDIRAVVGIQGFVKDAPLSLIFVADLSRLSGSESEKMSYAWIDTGYISQNVYLFCAAENLATVAIGWVDKEILKSTMRLKSSQHIILVQPVGLPR